MMEHKYKNYQALIRDSRRYNCQLQLERSQRLPFVDSHTGIAQADCTLWHSEQERISTSNNERTSNINTGAATLFRYPAQRWQKSRREYLMNCEFPSAQLNHAAIDSSSRLTPSAMSTGSSSSSSSSTFASESQANEASTQSTTTCSGESSDLANLESASLLLTSRRINSSPISKRPNCRSDSMESYNYCHLDSSDSRDQSINSLISRSASPPALSHDLDDEQPHLIESSFRNHLNNKPMMNGESADAAQVLTKSSLSSKIKDILSSKRHKSGANEKATMKSESILINGGRKANNKLKNGLAPTAASNGSRVEEVKAEYNNSNNNYADASKSQRNKCASPPAQVIAATNSSRPFVCSLCDQSYKTRPGLSYHFIHKHDMILPKNKKATEAHEKVTPPPPAPPSQPPQMADNGRDAIAEPQVNKKKRQKKFQLPRATPTRVLRNNCRLTSEAPIPVDEDKSLTGRCSNVESNDKNSSPSVDAKAEEAMDCDNDSVASPAEPTKVDEPMENQGEPAPSSPIAGSEHDKIPARVPIVSDDKTKRQNLFCDFCLGTAERNRRTRLPEELISCSSCGSSGHPSCLQFSDNVRSSVKKYDWQCIDCKTCSTCNAADNEDQLMFCDDCDRSFHTYCLKPPLKSLPEGNWSCDLCTKEYYGEQK